MAKKKKKKASPYGFDSLTDNEKDWVREMYRIMSGKKLKK